MAAAADGEVRKLWYVATADLVPGRAAQYIEFALDGLRSGGYAAEFSCRGKDGVIRHFQRRPDGSARDTHMYSIVVDEWPDVRRHLHQRLQRHARRE